MSLARAVWRSLRQRPEPLSAGQVSTSLRCLDPDDHLDSEHDDPVFLLATGWRTGSTLLQRILSTDRRILIWGEPLGRMVLLSRIAQMVCGISDAWPPPEYWIDAAPGDRDLVRSWTANLFPPGRDLRTGLRRLLDEWLGRPARDRGFARWGFKEVRLGAAEATVLRWLYPRAHLVVLTRHPVAAYASIKASGAGWRLHARWPERVDCVTSFARHWDDLARSWGEVHLGQTLLRHEDVVSEAIDWASLGRSLGLALSPADALRHRIGATGSAPVGRVERWILLREARRGAACMGYAPHSFGRS